MKNDAILNKVKTEIQKQIKVFALYALSYATRALALYYMDLDKIFHNRIIVFELKLGLHKIFL